MVGKEVAEISRDYTNEAYIYAWGIKLKELKASIPTDQQSTCLYFHFYKEYRTERLKSHFKHRSNIKQSTRSLRNDKLEFKNEELISGVIN